MKKKYALSIFMLLAIISCKEKKEPPVEETTVKEVLAKTYAEISIKEGGQWEGKEYVGDNFTFKNIDYLKAPDSLTDHSYFVRYEGPGWESSKVGYRLYFDWRNAIDIFGKKVDTMVLSKVGQDNYDSYHEEAPWGQDILKAGKSLGIGSYGRFDGENSVAHFQEVDSTTVQIHNSMEGSGVTLNYFGWNAFNEVIDLQTSLMIAPDSRMTKVTLTTSQKAEGLSTGIVKFEGVDVIQKESENGEWAYLATYGEQTLVPDDLGMAIFYKAEEVEELVQAEFDHLVVFKPTTTSISYFFAAAWQQELNGITSREDFIFYLDEELKKLN